MRIKNEEARPNTFMVTIGKQKNQTVTLESGWNESVDIMRRGKLKCSESELVSALQNNPFFAGLESSDKMVIKFDKQAAKEIEAKLKAETEARKAESKANAAADEEARKAEDQAIKAMKDAIVELGMDRKSLNGKNLKALESIYENLKKVAQ